MPVVVELALGFWPDVLKVAGFGLWALRCCEDPGGKFQFIFRKLLILSI